MKISLRWIFDHINGELAQIDVPQLVDTFIKTTAEIEGWKEVSINTDALTLVRVTNIDDARVTLYSPEHNAQYIVPKRSDASIDQWFMIHTADGVPSWATSILFGGAKDMMLPAIYCLENMRNGGWKAAIEQNDYIIE